MLELKDTQTKLQLPMVFDTKAKLSPTQIGCKMLDSPIIETICSRQTISDQNLK